MGQRRMWQMGRRWVLMGQRRWLMGRWRMGRLLVLVGRWWCNASGQADGDGLARRSSEIGLSLGLMVVYLVLVGLRLFGVGHIGKSLDGDGLRLIECIDRKAIRGRHLQSGLAP